MVLALETSIFRSMPSLRWMMKSAAPPMGWMPAPWLRSASCVVVVKDRTPNWVAVAPPFSPTEKSTPLVRERMLIPVPCELISARRRPESC